MNDAFARVRLDDAEKALSLLRNNAIEHVMYPFTDKFSEWVTIHLNNSRNKKAFEQLCIENGITTQDNVVIHRMLDHMLEDGLSPANILEKATITQGMAKSFNNASKLKYRCKECDLAVPVYRGAYPKTCPTCGGELREM